MMHEAQLHEENSFITLTYDDKKIPQYGSLNKAHMVKFMKDLRYQVHPKKIKFFQCGEYGDETQRPHHHAILFNHDFEDKNLYSKRDGIINYSSEHLDSIWQHGMCITGDVTFESCAYVARYVTKKMTGKGAEELNEAGLKYYERITEDGQIIQLEPEYATMSRGGTSGKGLSYEWYQRYKNEVYPADSVVFNGYEIKPPAYYDSIYEFEDKMEAYKNRQKRKSLVNHQEQTPERLEAKRRVKEAQLNFLKSTI